MSSIGKDPEWLKSLQGDSPLLGRSEWEYIAKVRRSIIREAKSRPSIPCDQHLKYKLSVMKNNFDKVVKYLKENSGSKEYFLRTYPEWRTVRDLTIFQLKEIAKSVNSDSQNCSVSKGVGSSVSLIGGIMALAAGNGAFRVLGGVLIGLGAATSAGTSSIELGLLQKKIKEAEKIIKEDREYSEKLWNWISDVSYIQDALDIIRNIVDVNLLKVANDFHTCYKKISSSADLKSIDLKSIDLRALKFLKASPEVMNEISDVVEILLASSMLYDRYRPLFNLVFEAYKCDKVLSTACDVIVATAKITSAVNASKNSELTALQKSKIVTGIALDAINILLASEGINSTSKEAKQIVKAAEKLKEEAEIFKKLYDGMK